MHPLDDVFIGCWVAFWVYWLAAAFTSKRTARHRSGAAIVGRLVVIVLVFSLARAGVFSGTSYESNPWLEAVGTSLFFAGLAVALWARFSLGRNWGMPMTEKAEPELVTKGPYQRIRHPIYSGIMLAMVGTMLALQWYWGIVVAVTGAYFIYSAVVEETNMTRLFPTTYPEYKRRTKMLVPFVF